MEVLHHQQIQHKIQRLAYQILEQNLSEDRIVLAGINNNGYRFASLLHTAITSISDKHCALSRISLNPANPLERPVESDVDWSKATDSTLIIVDDVANTGRTLFYAFAICMPVLVRKVQVAVLVDRKHKLFPIMADYVGLSLATTIGDHIEASLSDKDSMSVTLK